jgi:glycosidase
MFPNQNKRSFADYMNVPYWVQDSIFYQIFPDRFYRSEDGPNSFNYQPWDAAPTVRGFKGGNLRGIIEKFDYLLDLGINALYLNPIFASSANHRYHTNDYFKIDPSLGTMQDYKALLDVAHKNGVRVVIDGVFNHTGRGFFAFSDILENGPESRYIDWYHIKKFPMDAFSPGKATDYLAWWDIKDLPKLNTNHPPVREYLMDVSRYWIEQGTDGWRLDVPAEIDDDAFWADFRRVVKDANPDAYAVGEIWDGNPRWVGDTHFDGLMHYPLRDAITDVLEEKITLVEFAEKMESYLTMYERENLFAMYLALGSHDTRRLITKMGGNVSKVKLAFLIQFANPGAPSIYYGDEIGLPGEKDPENRRGFPWDESQWNTDLHSFVQKLITARKRHAALRRGDLARLHLSEENAWYAFSRRLGDDGVVVALNLSDETRQVTVPVQEMDWTDGDIVEDLVSGSRYRITENTLTLTLAPWSGCMVGTLLS